MFTKPIAIAVAVTALYYSAGYVFRTLPAKGRDDVFFSKAGDNAQCDYLYTPTHRQHYSKRRMDPDDLQKVIDYYHLVRLPSDLVPEGALSSEGKVIDYEKMSEVEKKLERQGHSKEQIEGFQYAIRSATLLKNEFPEIDNLDLSAFELYAELDGSGHCLILWHAESKTVYLDYRCGFG